MHQFKGINGKGKWDASVFKNYHIEYKDYFGIGKEDSYTSYDYHCLCHDFHGFTYHLFNNRYLIIIGGTVYLASDHKDKHDLDEGFTYIPYHYNLNRIVVLDLEKFRWLITHQVHKSMNHHSSVLTKNSNIYVVGNRPGPTWKSVGAFFKINLNATRLPWICERQIWIAFYKNFNNNECYIHQLPKDVIFFILKFCQWTIFEQCNNVLDNKYTYVFQYPKY